MNNRDLNLLGKRIVVVPGPGCLSEWVGRTGVVSAPMGGAYGVLSVYWDRPIAGESRVVHIPTRLVREYSADSALEYTRPLDFGEQK